VLFLVGGWLESRTTGPMPGGASQVTDPRGHHELLRAVSIGR
jgi:hypothetical protein